MKRFVWIHIILLYCLLLLLSCSTGPVDTIAGGTDYPNTKTIAGVIVTEDGIEATNALVMLIPSGFNPVLDGALPDSLVDTTGADGAFSVTFNAEEVGACNIHAIHPLQKTHWFMKDVAIAPQVSRLDLSPCVLTEPGAVNIILPDTVDTTNGYIYIKGTTFQRDIKGGTFMSDNHYAVVITNLPAGSIPSIIYVPDVQSDKSQLISDTTQILSNDTVIAGTNDPNLKPMWRFSVVVGVTEQTAQYYGGVSAIRALIEAHIEKANSKFNDPDIFSGVIEYFLDSLYLFDTDVSDECAKPHTGFDYRIIYDTYSNQNVVTWFKSNNTMYIGWIAGSGGGIFGNLSVDGLTWLFGLGRGGISLSWITVKADNNPINSQAFSSVSSILNYPFGVDVWDEYNTYAINHEADKVYDNINVIHQAFPASVGVVVRSAMGLPIASAIITVYGVKWNTHTVIETPLLSGITDSTGEYVFPQNPFKPDTSDAAIYGNLLITAANGSDTTYTWMPINEVGIAYFKDQTADFKVPIFFDSAGESTGK